MRKSSLRQPSSAITRILAENVRSLRQDQGLSQEQLADRCGLHRTYVGSVERCERNVTLSTLEALSDGLGITVPALLTRKAGQQ
jgi:transcriptional regulator with XRE-family HTH domain